MNFEQTLTKLIEVLRRSELSPEECHGVTEALSVYTRMKLVNHISESAKEALKKRGRKK